ncbi:hypothetical protein [Paractinoplanes rishiriensis]|uniref:UspA domain-containing protein n=1 Tax=Paractinoplanes rishiriensis TaxID=1050105 RepID=A0A919KAK0_9ACTN|nr:hypothetical protein [Actinoplanes rishiriensis]GIF01765.1 hypothetical protein Ari01nite_92290 [Actinoplanes rishiriensis]
MAHPIEDSGTVTAGILTVDSAEDVVRHGFAVAQDHGVALHVLLMEQAANVLPTGELTDLIERWAEKYPQVPVTVSVRAGIDAAIVLAAASRRCGLLVLAAPHGARETGVFRAVRRRARCPLSVAKADPGGGGAAGEPGGRAGRQAPDRRGRRTATSSEVHPGRSPVS